MNTDKRLNQLLEMLNEEPSDSFLRFAIALEYDKLNRPDEALRYFQLIVTDDPDYVGVYLHLGNLYLQMNRHDEAVHTYRAGIERTKTKDPKTCNELMQALQEIE
ncbi:MAG: tetratricopeptide repeat protein [Bacteroidota bacterium]|jgi:tetratricopeptide (TPR) repeat protein